MIRVLDLAAMLIGGELLAFGWQPNAIDSALSPTVPSVDKTPWALACGAAATLWALERIAHSPRRIDTIVPQPQPENSREKRN